MNYYILNESTLLKALEHWLHLELGEGSHQVLPVALKLAAGVSHQEQLSQMDVVFERLNAAQTTNKVHSEVQLLQGLTA